MSEGHLAPYKARFSLPALLVCFVFVVAGIFFSYQFIKQTA